MHSRVERRAQERGVDHHRPVPLVVLAHELDVEPFGQREVALQGGELPPSAEGLLIQSAAKRAIVLVDGDKGEVKGHCATAAQQLTVTLP